MKNIRLLIVVLLLVLIQSCSEETEPIIKDHSNEIIPLAVGHKWEYHIDIYDTTGNITWNFNSSNIIIGDSTIENTKWFYFDKNALYFSLLPDGYHYYNKYETDSLKNILVYKFPCNAGETYNDYKVAKVDTQITVPAGTFNCIMYSLRKESSSDFANIDFFIKPGVGIVKTIEYGFLTNHHMFIYKTDELLSYQFQ